MRFIKRFKNIDFFGQPNQFTLQNDHNQTSAFGGFLTLIFLGTFASMASRGFINLIYRNNLSCLTTDVYHFSLTMG